MISKEIYLKIDNLIKEKYRSLHTFCKRTKRSYFSTNKTFNNNIYNGKGAYLSTTEEILNDLGYELTIKKKDRKEAV